MGPGDVDLDMLQQEDSRAGGPEVSKLCSLVLQMGTLRSEKGRGSLLQAALLAWPSPLASNLPTPPGSCPPAGVSRQGSARSAAPAESRNFYLPVGITAGHGLPFPLFAFLAQLPGESRPNRKIFSHLGPACFAYLLTLHQHLATDKRQPVVRRPLSLCCPLRSWTQRLSALL